MAVNGVHPRAAAVAADTSLAAATAAAKVVVRVAATAAVKKVVRVVVSSGKHADEPSSAGLVRLV